ncbi:MAG: hypothetical protein MJ101_03825 [Clostridia bacterium]|nr:hypothetical protein [Clostridia bacterium]
MQDKIVINGKTTDEMINALYEFVMRLTDEIDTLSYKVQRLSKRLAVMEHTEVADETAEA